MSEQRKIIHDDNNGLDYVLVGDYYMPMLALPEENRPIGYRGILRKQYLKKHKSGMYIVIPEVSSQRRRYVPMGFFTPNIFCSNLVKIIPDATLYHFGVLTSNVHMAWMRVVCGRLKSDYRYSKDIVYNNFPWPEPSTQQRQKIEQTAQAILDARALYPDSSLADLYDELTMPPELRKAHHQNDMAVMQAYGFTKGSEAYKSEAACVAELMQRYQKLCEEQK